MKPLSALLILMLISHVAWAQKTKPKEEYEGCNGIQDADRKQYCLAIDQGDASLCKKIGNNDRRQLCLAKLENSAKQCERISDNKTKQRCLQSIR